MQYELHFDVMRHLKLGCCCQLCLCLPDLCHLDALLARRLDSTQQRGDVDLTFRWLGEAFHYLTSQIALLSKSKSKHSVALRQ